MSDMNDTENKFQDVGTITEAKVDVPHAEKESNYNRHHKFGNKHVDRKSRHPNANTGGKFQKSRNSFKKHDDDDSIRVEKKLADLMGCQKSDITKLIEEGKVKINDIVVKDLSLRVTFDDTIHVNGRMIPNKKIPLKVYLFNKPKGYIVTNSDPQGRPTIFDIIPTKLGKLITIGRLDFNSEGLMVLTNNGDYARSMELPSSNLQREYRVRVFGSCDMEKLRELKNGIEIDGIQYGRVFVTEEKEGSNDSANKWLRVTLYEGKNREIRKIMDHFGLQVNRLIRLSYGKYQLGTLPSGCASEVKPIGLGGSSPKHDKFKKKPNFSKRKYEDK